VVYNLLSNCEIGGQPTAIIGHSAKSPICAPQRNGRDYRGLDAHPSLTDRVEIVTIEQNATAQKPREKRCQPSLSEKVIFNVFANTCL
jgi:hypothetical protein